MQALAQSDIYKKHQDLVSDSLCSRCIMDKSITVPVMPPFLCTSRSRERRSLNDSKAMDNPCATAAEEHEAAAPLPSISDSGVNLRGPPALSPASTVEYSVEVREYLLGQALNSYRAIKKRLHTSTETDGCTDGTADRQVVSPGLASMPVSSRLRKRKRDIEHTRIVGLDDKNKLEQVRIIRGAERNKPINKVRRLEAEVKRLERILAAVGKERDELLTRVERFEAGASKPARAIRPCRRPRG